MKKIYMLENWSEGSGKNIIVYEKDKIYEVEEALAEKLVQAKLLRFDPYRVELKVAKYENNYF